MGKRNMVGEGRRGRGDKTKGIKKEGSKKAGQAQARTSEAARGAEATKDFWRGVVGVRAWRCGAVRCEGQKGQQNNRVRL
jgi:hypothetical protein